MRKILFWMHLGAGVLVSALIFYFSVTGAMLAYERPLMQAADRRFYHPGPTSKNAAPIPLDALAASAIPSLPQSVESLTIHQDPQLPLEISAANRTVFLVDRYTGKVQGPASPGLRSFFAQVTALHRWFGLSNTHHRAATAVKGATTLLLLFLLVSGAVLWIPKGWTSASVQRGMVPRLGTTGRARNYNWHKVAGFWTLLPLSVIVVTGVIMAYPWANAALFRLAGSPAPRRAENGGRSRGVSSPALPAHLQEAFAAATLGITDWQTASLRLPAAGPVMSITVDRGDGGHPDKREQVAINVRSLQPVRREPFAAMSRGQRWRAWVRFSHTGEAGGWWGETLALLTACGAIVLSITGVLLSLDRLRRWRGSARRQTAASMVGAG